MSDEREVPKRFEGYIDQLAETLAHADRVDPLHAYCAGLVVPGEDKSVEPIAAKTAPERVSAQHQSLLHFVGQSTWSDRALMNVATAYAVEGLETHSSMERYLIDDTGFPKKGKHSVGVANQYCGCLGKNANSQVTVTVSIANDVGSVPVAVQLYLPRKWAEDDERRAKAKVPEEMVFAPKWAIALDLMEAHLMDDEHELGPLPVGADAGYGDVKAFRQGLRDMGLPYTVGVKKTTSVTVVSLESGSRATRRQHKPEAEYLSLKAVAQSLPAGAWKPVSWRQGVRGEMKSRFALLKVRTKDGYDEDDPEDEVEQLLIEWPEDEAEPTRYWLSTENLALSALVRAAKMRWRIERDYQDMKVNFGLDKYQGRGWIGFHHHWSLCVAVYAFAVAERSRFSPLGPLPEIPVRAPGLPDDYRPRGAPLETRSA